MKFPAMVVAVALLVIVVIQLFKAHFAKEAIPDLPVSKDRPRSGPGENGVGVREPVPPRVPVLHGVAEAELPKAS
jgi:hypothetical protein